jgi:hypothetical protein
MVGAWALTILGSWAVASTTSAGAVASTTSAGAVASTTSAGAEALAGVILVMDMAAITGEEGTPTIQEDVVIIIRTQLDAAMEARRLEEGQT